MIIALILMSSAMALAWLVQMLKSNCSWVDMCWTYGVGITAVAILLTVPSPRRWWMMAAIVAWSLRLGTSIALRSAGKREDPRYHKYRGEWGANFQRHMFWFLQFQALVSWPILFGIWGAAGNKTAFGIHDVIALIIAFGSIAGEGLADTQLTGFRRSHPHSGICDVGLWRWSRHPNYFFETLFWCALPFFAAPLPAAMALACLAPLTIYILLNYVSGIPPLEAYMLKTRGDDFRAYQARTSAFFPLPPGPSK